MRPIALNVESLMREVSVASTFLRARGAASLVALITIAACQSADEVTTPSRNASAENSAVALVPQFANFGSPSVPGAVPAPPGLRACWSAENNPIDVVSNNVGALSGTAGYTAGRFGQGFNFLALHDGINVPSHPSINFGASASGITMSAWVYGRGTMFQPSGGIAGFGPIVEWDGGAHLWQHSQQNGTETLFTNLAEGVAAPQWHILFADNVVSANAWYHTAVTYSKLTGDITLYVNGVPRASANHGVFSPNTTTTFRIGRRAAAIIGEPTFTFNGVIDEVQIYDRGLSAAEVFQLSGATGTMCVPPPVSYQVSVMPVGSGESGVPFTTQPQVVILDANDNIVSNATTAVTATVTSGTGTLLGTTTINAVNGVATFTDLAIAGAANTTIGFTAAGLPPEAGFPTVSGPLPTVQIPRKLFLATQPGGATSGSPLVPQPVVMIQDAAGLTVPGATNAVTAVSSGPGVLSGTTTINAVNALAAFSDLVLTGAGTSTLSFTSTGLTPVTGSASNIVAVLGPVALRFVIPPPANGETGFAFPTQPRIEVVDANGNLVPSATGTVSAQLVSGTGTLVGNPTAALVGGVATFTNLQINGFGNFTLSFTHAALPALTSNIAIVQRPRNLVIIAGPTTVTSTLVMAPAWQIELRDATNTKILTATHQLTVAVDQGPGVSLTAGVLSRNAVAGVATFPDLAATGTGTFRLKWTVTEPGPDHGLSAVTSPTLTLQVPAVTQIALVTPPSASVQSGVPFPQQPVVELRTASGARATAATGTVTVQLASGTGLGGATTVPVVGGLASFTNLQITGSGNFTLGFTYATLPAVTANVTVTAPPPPPPPAIPLLTGVVRRGPTFNSSGVNGSLQVLTGEDITLNGGASISGSLYVPGTPTVRATGQAGIGTIVDGTGSASPSGYEIRLNGQSQITKLVRKTNPVTMPVVAAPLAPTGTRLVQLNQPSDPIGAWGTLHSLTANGAFGTIAAPAGAYGAFTIGGSNVLQLGVAGSSTPSVYHFQSLTLTGSATISVVGPVVITVGSAFTAGNQVGAALRADWLTLNIYSGGLTLNGNANFYGTVIAPSGAVNLTGNSKLTGNLAADQLTLSGNKTEVKFTVSIP
jgi:hypothetical protein